MQRHKGVVKTKLNIQETWDNFKKYNIFIIRVLEGKKRMEQKK